MREMPRSVLIGIVVESFVFGIIPPLIGVVIGWTFFR